ncbi:hypothetical protein [Zhongshania sp. BJYM1]|jgi:hypothetical protein|uniref:hypothetical protein n=1 Tax=Zhongshania aquatica TaxID=2965069 RepID=UPI0022B2E613|nr:hypothetical protein [Marortus sp. BJYM1]
MALFAIDGDVGCLFSLLTFFLGMQKESKSPSEGETKANSKPKELVEDQISKQKHSLCSNGYPIGVGYDEAQKNQSPTNTVDLPRPPQHAPLPFSAAEHCGK